MKKFLLVIAMVLAVYTSSALYADTIFNFSFQSVRTKGLPGVAFGGSGQLDAQETSVPGTFVVKGITGTTLGLQILGLQPYGNQYLFLNNDLVSLNTSGIKYLLPYGSAGFAAGDISSVTGINTGYIATLDLRAFLLVILALPAVITTKLRLLVLPSQRCQQARRSLQSRTPSSFSQPAAWD